MARDLRIYKYENGNLKKIGSNKSTKFKILQHYFTNIQEIKEHIEWCRIKGFYYESQIVIVEYFDSYKSRIIEIIE